MEEPRFIFTTPFNVNVVEEKGIERVFLEGLVSTTDLDLVNDIVTKNCLESMQRQILDRNIKLDIEHEAFRGDTPEEKEINKTKVPAGKITDATVVDLGDQRFGLRIKAELNRFNQRFDEIKGNVLERYLDAYSIAFIPTKVAHVEKDGVEIRLLDENRLLNIAMTGNAINTGALNQKVFLKAIDAVEEYKKDKLKNPELGDQLEVKTSPQQRRTQARNEALREKEEEDEDDKKKKKEEKAKHSAKWHRCVTKVGKMGGVRSPEAVCTAALGPESYKAFAKGEEITEKEEMNIRLIHNHLRDKLNNRRLKMAEDQPEEISGEDAKKPEGEETSEETPEAPETTDAPEATETPETAEGEDAEGAEAPATEEKAIDLKAVNDRLDKQDKDIAEIKALLKKPVHKAMSETKKPSEAKAVEPLDAVK